MLSDRWYRLLTGYVDGVLSPRERRAVELYVQKSPEAHALLEKLQGDAERLRRLPRRQLGPDFAEQVLQRVRDGAFPPVEPIQVPRVAGLGWNRWALAAAVFLAVGGGAILYLMGSPDGEGGRAVATQRDRGRPIIPQGPESRNRPAVASANSRPGLEGTAQDPEAPDEGRTQPSAEPARDVNSRVASGSNPERNDEALVVAPTPLMELFPELKDLRLAVVFPLRELKQGTPNPRLQELLNKEPACRVHLSCTDSSPALERLQTAFVSQGIRLLLDQLAQERLKKRLATNYVLYVENVTPAELNRVLRRLSEDDAQAESRRRGDGQFERVVVDGLQPADHAELSKLLGADPSKLQPVRPKTPLGVDIRRPLADQTADQVVKSLKGQGAPTERVGIVLPYNPVRPRPAVSKEVKLFFDNRKEPCPGTVQVLLVLRGKKG
jgi:hypothetical protein